MVIISRPKTPVLKFEEALKLADLTENELELIEYIRYIGVFTQPLLVKELRLNPKPPVLSVLCVVCRKIGNHIPDHFEAVRTWSKSKNKYGVRWDGELICSNAFNIDGEELSPEAATTPYETLVVHKELFKGLD